MSDISGGHILVIKGNNFLCSRPGGTKVEFYKNDRCYAIADAVEGFVTVRTERVNSFCLDSFTNIFMGLVRKRLLSA